MLRKCLERFLNGSLPHVDQLNVTLFISCDVKYLFIIIENINLLLQLKYLVFRRKGLSDAGGKLTGRVFPECTRPNNTDDRFHGHKNRAKRKYKQWHKWGSKDRRKDPPGLWKGEGRDET